MSDIGRSVVEEGVLDQSLRRTLLQRALSARKGGRIGTEGRGAVALRFDDAPAEFRETVLPLLRERGLPFTRVTTSESVGAQRFDPAELPLLEKICLDAGGEVWNHGRDHLDATGPAGIRENLIGALDALRTAMPALPVDCFAPPGGSAVSYDGHMPSRTLEHFSETYAGRLLMSHHALVSGYIPSTYYRSLDGALRDGQVHYSVDSYDARRAKQLVDRARDWRVGVCLMWHSHAIGGRGMALEDFRAVLDHLVAEREAGRVMVLTLSGMAVADASTAWRDDLLSTHEGAEVFRERILHPQFRQNAVGSTRELTAHVSGDPGRVVTSAVGASVRSHRIGADGTLALRHPVTIPVDATALMVSIDAPSTQVHLQAV